MIDLAIYFDERCLLNSVGRMHESGTSTSVLVASLGSAEPRTKGRDAVIGAAIGGAAGMVTSIVMLTSSRHFYLDAGAPIGMTLQQSVTLPQDEVAKAVRQSQEHAVAVQPVAPRPMPPPAPTIPVNQSRCYTPGTPATPGTPYPCP